MTQEAERGPEPSIESILRDLAIRLGRLGPGHAGSEPQEPLSRSEWGQRTTRADPQSAAARAMAEQHRAEAAELLRCTFLKETFRAPLGGLFYMKRPSRQVDLEVPLRALQRGRARLVLRLAAESGIDLEAKPVLRAIARQAGQRPSLVEIARAAWRLQPTEASRVHLAIAHLLERRPAGTVRVLRGLIESGCSREIGPHAWETLGIANALLGHQAQSLRCYLEAARLAPERYTAAISVFFKSMEVGDECGARASSARVEGLLDADDPAIEHFIQVQRVKREIGLWKPSEPGRRLALRWVDSAGTTSNRIASVFHEHP